MAANRWKLKTCATAKLCGWQQHNMQLMITFYEVHLQVFAARRTPVRSLHPCRCCFLCLLATLSITFVCGQCAVHIWCPHRHHQRHGNSHTCRRSQPHKRIPVFVVVVLAMNRRPRRCVEGILNIIIDIELTYGWNEKSIFYRTKCDNSQMIR